MIIIPAIDIIGGKCVRLSQGDYSRGKVYSSDPVELARRFEDHGFKRLHLVDLDGARSGSIVNLKILENIRKSTGLIIDFGGGIKSDRDARLAFESGADQITGGSIAVRNPDTFLSWLAEYGSGKIILGADHRNGMIALTGWTEDSGYGIREFIRNYARQGVKKVICTDISLDGMLSGPSTGLYRELVQLFPELELIASGGVGDIKHIYELREAGIQSVIVGKAIYEGRIKLDDFEEFLTN